ncbi:MAG: dTMP kinase, partial [Planctomycetota bacterium]|nr:dTMP kinase [Planctomycetota bacterium]
MTATPTYPGRFIVLDGVDGCGKSTQAKRLVHSLRTEGEVEVQHLREPGSTTLGEGLRELLLSRD